jgi:predicted nucleic-acid-binding protein
MRLVDANVILRYLLEDDQQMAERASHLLEHQQMQKGVAAFSLRDKAVGNSLQQYQEL